MNGQMTDGAVKVITDTRTILSTIRLEKPKAIDSMKRADKPVILTVTEKEIVYIHDSVYVYLPTETKLYQDSLYSAQVSGVQPSLDWIDVYPKTKIVTISDKIRTPKWGIGVTLGYGVGKEGLTPYIGLGVQYNLLSW